MEKLAQYLKDNGIRRYQFAERIGVAKSTMTQLIQGKYPPSLAVALKIEAETGGYVTVGECLQ